MVDIVQSNENKLLIRRIGYSVGLELTLLRLEQVAEVYVSERQLSDSSWRDLVLTTFKRTSPTAAKEFENVFSVLGIFTIANGRPVPQNVLDAVAVLKRIFHSKPVAFQTAMSAVFLQSLIAADGELFAALLRCNFGRHEIANELTNFRKDKLTLLYEHYKTQFEREKLHQVIDFQDLTGGATSQKVNPREGPFARPTAQKKKQNPMEFTVSLSSDWHKKVPPRRQAWAEDLHLIDDGKLTQRGISFLRAVDTLTPDPLRGSSVVLMPMDSELRAKHVTTLLPQEYIQTHSRHLGALCSVFVDDSCQEFPRDDLEDLARTVYDLYSKADSRFQMLRRELPFTLFSSVLLGICAAERKRIGNLQVNIEEIALERRNLLLRPSRNSIFGISFPKSS